MRHNTAPTAPFLKSFRHTLALLLTGISLSLWADHTPEPTSVTVAGSLQSELGCPGDWQPDCAATHLTYDAEDEVWQGVFNVPAGMWEYKAALNGSWDENYGLGAVLNGTNIPLDLAAETPVKFYYSHATHWVTDDWNSVIAVAPAGRWSVTVEIATPRGERTRSISSGAGTGWGPDNASRVTKLSA